MPLQVECPRCPTVLEELDGRQGYRGPTGHLAGAALQKHRAMLTAALRNTVRQPKCSAMSAPMWRL